MENQPAQVSPSTQVTTPTAGDPAAGAWPAVPPAPAPIKPQALVVSTASEPRTERIGRPARVAGAALIGDPDDDAPTMTIRTGPPGTGSAPPPAPPPRRADRGPAGAPPQVPPPDESPIVALQRSVRRQQALARSPREDLVWQPRFAYGSALIILFALTVISAPLWIVLYRITGGTNGPAVADLVALCMMLLGGFLTSSALWVIVIEMRSRVRMVDTLAKTGEREVMVAPASPEIPGLDTPLDNLVVTKRGLEGEPVAWEPGPIPPHISARVEAQQVSAAATLEASSKLLSAFSSVLKSFGQLPAQVAMLTVALALFVGATVLSLD